jgi:hypothetical protein
VRSQVVERIVNSLLYEGYLLYPYRKSALKNQDRWHFGIIHPKDRHPSSMTTECLLEGSPTSFVDVEVRFLRVESRSSEGIERRIALPRPFYGFGMCRREMVFGDLRCVLEVSVMRVQQELRRIRVHIKNDTSLASGIDPLSHSMVSTHTILSAHHGQFVSLLEPPPEFSEAAAACRNEGTWPVLVGQAPDRDCVLSSPIIVYDYPLVAAESGARSRQILDRAESLSPEEILDLHGSMRPVNRIPRQGDRVRLKPRPGADAFDVVLDGKIGIVESVRRDFEDRVHVAVVIEDNPGRDLGLVLQPRHRFFFSTDELEVLP